VSLITLLKKFFNNHSDKKVNGHNEAIISPPEKPSLYNKPISRNAIKIIKRLNKAGYEAYLVGGSVRDLLLDLKPKDFDIATSATPEQIRKLFRNCRLIGRRFRLAHIYFANEIIEVSTFRAANKTRKKTDKCATSGMILRDNTYGTQQEDAQRRDFTVNAFYYDPKSDQVIDAINGLTDIEQRQIRIIGDAETRYREDPIRMLRAIRFSSKLDFNIAAETAAPFSKLHQSLWNVSAARLFEEVLKLFFSGHAMASYKQLCHYDFFTFLFPQTATLINENNFQTLLQIALENTDKRLAVGKSINPAFLLAVILWLPLEKEIRLQQTKHSAFMAQQNAMQLIIQRQLETLAIPKRLSKTIKEIWELQYQLPRRHGKRAFYILAQPRFRAAYDFLLLRAITDTKLQILADWWTQFQEADLEQQNDMINALPKHRRFRKSK